MLTDVKLYGELGELYGKEFTFDVNTPKEAVSALITNFKKFKETLNTEGNSYVLVYGDKELEIDDIMLKTFDKRKVLKIIPVVAGAKSGWVSVIIGAILVVAASIMMGPGGGMAVMEAMMAGTATAMQVGGLIINSIGMSMISAGVAQILAPTPGTPVSAKKDENYYFDGPVTTTAQGQPVPIAYGQLRVGGAVITAEINSEED